MFLAQSPIKYGDNAKCKCAPICYKVSEIIVKERKIGKFMPPHTVFIQKFPNTTVQDKINTLYILVISFGLIFYYTSLFFVFCCVSVATFPSFFLSHYALFFQFPYQHCWLHSPEREYDRIPLPCTLIVIQPAEIRTESSSEKWAIIEYKIG